MLPAGVHLANFRRSAFGARRFSLCPSWESLRRCQVRSRSPRPPRESVLDRCRELPRAITSRGKLRELAAGKTLGMPKASASAAGEVHCCVNHVLGSLRPLLETQSRRRRRRIAALQRLARICSLRVKSAAAATQRASLPRRHRSSANRPQPPRGQHKQDGRLVLHGQLAPHVAVAATKKSALDRQRLAPELAPRVDAPARQ